MEVANLSRSLRRLATSGRSTKSRRLRATSRAGQAVLHTLCCMRLCLPKILRRRIFMTSPDFAGFRVRRLWPQPEIDWRLLTPVEWAHGLLAMRDYGAGRIDRE